ncbi:cyclin-like protein [Achlya hypogyna]|uniref:Cyclin-like protein n=1 Tax=Achlya hypogyna TaxID=1202772 RepID=A0A1V9YK60_ACHHY|nr:cyclin-like protein [Achlya hypogyna]
MVVEVERKRKRGALEDISNMQGRPTLRMNTRMKTEAGDHSARVKVEARIKVADVETQSTQPSQEMSCHPVPAKKMKLEHDSKLRRSQRLPSPPVEELPHHERQRLFDIKMSASNSEFELNDYMDQVTMIDSKVDDALAREIDAYHRKHEEKYRLVTNYIQEGSRELTARMRMILMDWLVEVGEEYKISPKALHLAISLVDRCLAAMTIPRGELQLMGCACMMTACKYEEVQCPTIEDFVYISDHTYTGERMLEMESKVLEALEFRISSTHVYHFLERFVLAGCTTDVQNHFAHYITELALLDYVIVQSYAPSVIAAAAVYLSRVVTNEQNVWTPTLHYYTKYNAVQVLDCVKLLHKAHAQEYDVLQTDANKTKAITDKYMSRKHFRVCKLAPLAPAA